MLSVSICSRMNEIVCCRITPIWRCSDVICSCCDVTRVLSVTFSVSSSSRSWNRHLHQRKLKQTWSVLCERPPASPLPLATSGRTTSTQARKSRWCQQHLPHAQWRRWRQRVGDRCPDSLSSRARRNNCRCSCAAMPTHARCTWRHFRYCCCMTFAWRRCVAHACDVATSCACEPSWRHVTELQNANTSLLKQICWVSWIRLQSGSKTHMDFRWKWREHCCFVREHQQAHDVDTPWQPSPCSDDVRWCCSLIKAPKSKITKFSIV